jgi:hypothetical protein
MRSADRPTSSLDFGRPFFKPHPQSKTNFIKLLSFYIHSFSRKPTFHKSIKMRFAAALVALAGAALAEEVSTVYSTEYYTVTSCAASVTNCPAHSTVVSSSVFPVVPTSTGVPHFSNSSVVEPPYPTTTHTAQPTILPTGGFHTTVAPAPVCPGHSVRTISTSVTTVIPTVIYETVEVPCPTGGHGGPGGPHPSGVAPSGTGSAPSVTGPSVPIVTGGASTMGGSIALAAAAGVLALLA